MYRPFLALLSITACYSYRVPLAQRGARSLRSRAPAPLAQEEVDMAETATAAMDSMMAALSPDVDPPKAMMGLKEAIQDGEPLQIGSALYDLVVENALDYDVNEDKVIVKSDIDFSNRDDPRVRDKITYAYTYGIGMFKRGYIAEDALKDAVINKVAARVNLDGPGLDKWLEMPAV